MVYYFQLVFIPSAVQNFVSISSLPSANFGKTKEIVGPSENAYVAERSGCGPVLWIRL